MNPTPDGPAPQRFRHALPDGHLAGLAWPAPDKPRLVFIHANGFCASAYRSVLSRLAADFDILAPDLRGHGTSRLPVDPDRHHNWHIYVRDICAWLGALDRPADALAGHSMGAIIAMMSAARQDQPTSLALVEPVVMPSIVYLTARSPFRGIMRGRIAIANAARKRYDGWPARSDAAKRYARHKTFRNWADGVLDDYLEDGLMSDGEGGVRLSCNPMWEAANYEAQGHDIGASLDQASGPIHVLKAEHASTIINRRALTGRGIGIDLLAGAGHLAPMEAPGPVADWIATRLTAPRPD
ncbi:alpha/beta fold hydrolase [Maricaulis maris]|jgi:pimeloyl-ACP methyl ester carboxylesterase|uniref:Alpha/beta hydrolase fold protein n=1 Tax=Maricaulis maris (strain MCS10) TaxID=394221 RepID=Q0AP22_MARMM|nr:alpha/beta hydrolase [Maricaulis maris]ABI65965.1 alpha/beta hydrolase fold protein [Maricaulis maris MCS10]